MIGSALSCFDEADLLLVLVFLSLLGHCFCDAKCSSNFTCSWLFCGDSLAIAASASFSVVVGGVGVVFVAAVVVVGVVAAAAVVAVVVVGRRGIPHLS